MSYLEKMDGYLDSLKVGKSALVDSWFMMSNPVPILTVVTLYLMFVRLGPKLMKNRPPMQMNKLMTYYNGSQVVLSVMLCYKAFKLNLFADGIQYAGCQYASTTQNAELLDLGWWYFFAKFTELLDTIFFILRKKEKQVTFLHVYHHGLMALYAWSYLKFAAGGQGAILALLNSSVHIVMYTYYLLAGLGPKFQKYLWWKKYVTTLQMTQFMLMLIYNAWTHYSPQCQFSTKYTYIISTNISFFLLLFFNFYAHSYKKNSMRRDKKGDEINGRCKSCSCNDTAPYDVKAGSGDYSNNAKAYLTRRSLPVTQGSDYNFESIIKK